MRKKVYLLFFLLLFAYVFGYASIIKIINPKSGDVWYRGKVYIIKWTKSGNMNSKVKIRLYQGKRKILGITNSTPNDGSFSWHIPTNIPDGNYKIRVKTVDNRVYDDSSIFTIRKSSVNTTGKIKIVSPNNLVKWEKDKVYEIRWNKIGNMNSYVKIRLYKGGTKVFNIVNMASNTGSYRWRIPRTLSVGTYYIRVKTIDNKVYDNSESFKIVNTVTRGTAGKDTVIKIITPRGGERIKIGTNFNITFKSNYTNRLYRLSLWQNGIEIGVINSKAVSGVNNWRAGFLEKDQYNPVKDGLYNICVKEWYSGVKVFSKNFYLYSKKGGSSGNIAVMNNSGVIIESNAPQEIDNSSITLANQGNQLVLTKPELEVKAEKYVIKNPGEDVAVEIKYKNATHGFYVINRTTGERFKRYSQAGIYPNYQIAIILHPQQTSTYEIGVSNTLGTTVKRITIKVIGNKKEDLDGFFFLIGNGVNISNKISSQTVKVNWGEKLKCVAYFKGSDIAYVKDEYSKKTFGLFVGNKDAGYWKNSFHFEVKDDMKLVLYVVGKNKTYYSKEIYIYVKNRPSVDGCTKKEINTFRAGTSIWPWDKGKLFVEFDVCLAKWIEIYYDGKLKYSDKNKNRYKKEIVISGLGDNPDYNKCYLVAGFGNRTEKIKAKKK